MTGKIIIQHTQQGISGRSLCAIQTAMYCRKICQSVKDVHFVHKAVLNQSWLDI